MNEPNTLNIRTAMLGDEQALALVGAATFLETYAHMVPGQDMLSHCSIKHGAENYAAWLRDPSVTIWLVETEVLAPVGYLVMTKATLPIESPQPEDLEVQRIYLLSRFQGTGTGQSLMNLAVEHASAFGAPRLVLGAFRENTRALAFYHRQQFRVIGDRMFQVGRSIFSDVVLARELQSARERPARAPKALIYQ